MPVRVSQYAEGEESAIEACCDAEGCSARRDVRWFTSPREELEQRIVQEGWRQLRLAGWETELRETCLAFCPEHSALGSAHAS